MKRIFAIVGPTASNKTQISYEIAKRLNLEIISFDSRQFFKELKIGSAMPEDHILKTVPHHFIGNKSIFDQFNAGEYEKEALKTIDKILSKKPKALMIGGSGLYLSALEKGFDSYPRVRDITRKRLQAIYDKKGIEALKQTLFRVDKDYYNIVDLKNHRRITRALEIYQETKIPYSKFRKNKPKNRSFKIYKIGIRIDKQTLNYNIENRIDKMIKDGLLEEVKSLYEHRGLNTLNTIGYKELFCYISGKYSLEQAIEEIKKNTKKLAKKQLTWFKKDKSIKWFDSYEVNKIINFINEN